MAKPKLTINTNNNILKRFSNNYMSSINESFADIDTAMSVLHVAPVVLDTIGDTIDDILNMNSLTFTIKSPLAYLFMLLNKLNVTDQQIIDFITNLLVYSLPAVEIGVKAALIANIKSLVSCTSDPRIPKYMRRLVTSDYYTDILVPDTSSDEKRRGIVINVDAIDPNGILRQSPFTEPGNTRYFGCEYDVKKYVDNSTAGVDGITIDLGLSATAKKKIPVDMLTRAEDFNAFLWYVMHNGKHPSPFKAEFQDGHRVKINNDTYEVIEGFNLFDALKLRQESDTPTDLVPGSAIVDSSKKQLSICVKRDFDGTYHYYTIWPVSYDWYSCNWYVDKSNYYKKNLGIKKKDEREYDKDLPICNLRYIDRDEYYNNEWFQKFQTNNNLIFTILPKPYFPDLKDGIFKSGKIKIRLMFDSAGNPDSNGRYSFPSEGRSVEFLRGDEDWAVYEIEFGKAFLWINKKNAIYRLSKSSTTPDSPISEAQATDILVECYKGLTIYEFNYDMIMGMKLFDPKVVANNIIRNAFNPAYGVTTTLSKTRGSAEYLGDRQRVLEVIRNILEEDDDEINDCFYSFSNQQYEDMQTRAEEIRYNQLPYFQTGGNSISLDLSSVNDILNEYPESGTLEEQKTVISHALTQTSAVVAEYNGNITEGKINFMSNLLEQLILSIVDAVVSPKLLLVMYVNNELMSSNENGAINTEQLMRIMKPIIKQLVKDIRDYIMREMLEFILKQLTQLALQMQAMVIKEKYQAYLDILKQLLSCFNMGVGIYKGVSSFLRKLIERLKRKKYKNDIDLPTVLDDITYADILDEIGIEEEPIINNC